MTQVAQRMTADEYLAGPEDPRRTELVEGEVIVHEPKNLHQSVVEDLFRALDAWAMASPNRGRVKIPLDIKLDSKNVFAPDLMWFATGRVPARDATPPYELPDLAIDVRSPSTWRYDIGSKRIAYERHGLAELWLVDTTAQEVLVFRRSQAKVPTFDIALEVGVDGELTSPLLPGLVLPLSRLFG